MSDNEIFARIASDVADVGNSMFGARDITIGMTEELFVRLLPGEHVLIGYDAMPRLFGCKIKVFLCSGLWWIVGYEGSAEEGE